MRTLLVATKWNRTLIFQFSILVRTFIIGLEDPIGRFHRIVKLGILNLLVAEV